MGEQNWYAVHDFINFFFYIVKWIFFAVQRRKNFTGGIFLVVWNDAM